MNEPLILAIFYNNPPELTEEQKDAIRRSLASLPTIQQTIIKEKYIKDKSIKSIAKEQCYSISSVNRFHASALHHLRKLHNPAYRNELSNIHAYFR